MGTQNRVLLFNPRSARWKYRIPNSILSVASSIEGRFDYTIVDGNRESDPLNVLCRYLESREYGYFGCTVMPGPQLKQAIPFTKYIRTHYPDITIIWGGYFPSNHPETVLKSGYVDYIINGPGEYAFPALLEALQFGDDLASIERLIYMRHSNIMRTHKPAIPNPDHLPPLPYETLHQFYNLNDYMGKTVLGNKTAAYHSSYGCPFTCSFCAVVPIYKAGWNGKSAENLYKDIKYLKERFGADSIEFHDNNFFVSVKRIEAFSELMKDEQMNWWGEGRIDTIDKYPDRVIESMREAGCRMIFFGAETGNDAVLKQMNKGGKQSGKQIKRFAERMRKFDIIPEYSFVLGTPAETEEQVWRQIEEDIRFIKEIKEINPGAEIIIYIYSPVPTKDSQLYHDAVKSGFRFPETLEEWISPQWEHFDLRKNPLTPWLKPEMVDKILGFETVLNARFPTVTDTKLSDFQRNVIKKAASLRYAFNMFKFPYELRYLQSRWLKYRQPEIEGM